MPKRKAKQLESKLEVKMTDAIKQPTSQSDPAATEEEVEKTRKNRSSRKKQCSSPNSPSPQNDNLSADKASSPLAPPESSERSNQAVVGVSEEDVKRWAEFTIPPPRRFPVNNLLGDMDRETQLYTWNLVNPKAYVTPQKDVTPLELHEEREFGYQKFAMGCTPYDKLYEGVVMMLEMWMDEYWETCDGEVDHRATIEARLTAEQKQAIVDRLGDWCLFHDWDSLVAHFSKKEFRFEVLAQALICKDIFDGVVKNPFYYMDLGEEWDGRADVLPPPFGQELFQLWQKFRSIDEVTADKWRSFTVRHLNRCGNIHTRVPRGYEILNSNEVPGMYVENYTPGLRCYNLRQAYINQLVNNMLDKSSLLSLLRPPLDPAQESDAHFTYHRRGLLRRIYASAAEGAVHMWATPASYILDENVKEIPPFRTPHRPWGGLQLKTWYHSSPGEYDQQREDLNGRRAVMVTWPTIWTIRREHELPQQEMLTKILGKNFTDIPEWIYYDDLGWSYHVVSPGTAHFAPRGLLGCPLEVESSAPPEKKAANEENPSTEENEAPEEEKPTGTK